MSKTVWSRDEYILLLDLYKRLAPRRAFPQTLPEVIALSRDLRQMNPAAVRLFAKHRNPAGVSFYLARMMAHDPNAIGIGIKEKESTSGYQLRAAVFHDFFVNEVALAAEIARIRSAYNLDQPIRPQWAAYQEQPDRPAESLAPRPIVSEPAAEPLGKARTGWRKWLYQLLMKLAQRL